jgi:hypothetical protein
MERSEDSIVRKCSVAVISHSVQFSGRILNDVFYDENV